MPNPEQHEKELLDLFEKDSEKAIDLLFRKYYAYLCKSIFRIIPKENIAEDLAQDVFFELWKKRDNINVNISFKAYLRRAGRNKALNFIRDQKIKWDDVDELDTVESKFSEASEKVEAGELKKLIDKSINELPDRCRLVFSLSRFEEMSYQEIADQLGISIKTVENQISKALKQLRSKLEPYLSEGMLFILSLIMFL